MIQLKKKNLIVLLLVAALLGGCAVVGLDTFILRDDVRLSGDEYAQYQTMISRYGKVDALYNTLNQYYYKELDTKALETAMCEGLFAGAKDPYTSYLTKEKYDNLLISTTGKLEGIGVTVSANTDDRIVVVSTIKDGPAEKIGMKSGDLILAVDDVEYKGSELDMAVANMRGEAGTKVKITYQRGNKQYQVDITRSKITLESVYAEKLEGNIGYIYISSFEEETAADFKRELHGFEVQGVEGLIIDLRNNGGGIVETAVDVADQLLGEGIVAYTEGRGQEKSYMNTSAGKTSIPYVVLINEATASASEIVAAGIQDNGGGKIIGMTSFGKGVIQSMAPLTDGDAIKMTVAQYFSPNGKVIHEVGVTPDIEVEIPENSRIDTQLKKAIEVLKEEMK